MSRSHPYSGSGLYRGRGGFFGGLGGLLTGQGYDAGSKWGDEMWSKIGKYGDSLDKDFGQYFKGSGLYRGRGLLEDDSAPVVNDLMVSGNASDDVVPRFHPSDISEVMYSNREYISDVYAPTSSAFQAQRISINPGLPACFPWLSQLAINFEEYELYQLAFTYKATVAEFAAASGQVGQVYMATQTNPVADAFANKEEMLMYNGSGSSKSTKHQIQGVECDPAKLPGNSAQKYVRAGNLPPGEDLKQYDLGIFNIAVENVPATYYGQQLGELWVSYTVKLRKPKLASGNAYNVHRDVFFTDNPTSPFLTGNSVAVLGLNSNSNLGLITGSRNVLGIQVIAPAKANETIASCPTMGTYVNSAGTTVSQVGLLDDFNSDSPSGAGIGSFSSYPNMGQFIFPDSFAGIVECTIAFMTDTVGATQSNPGFYTQGNIARFKDMPWTNSYLIGEQKWSHRMAVMGDNENQSMPECISCF